MMNALSGQCFLIAVLSALGCRPEPDGQLQIQVHAQHADAETVVPDIQLTLARRVLADGILNGNYETVANTQTDGSGIGELNFQRVNALDYRLTASGLNWFSLEESINPDVFIDSKVLSLDFDVMPRANVYIQLINTNPFQTDDAIEFRTLNIVGTYATCSNAWEYYTGLDVDVQRSCNIEADRYLPYIYRVYRNNEWTEMVDSLYIAQGDSASLQIAW
ncbi:MAG: hypothetical protein OSA78_08265 [Flavobacteriales bacterium]|nr:hypothetical protein [Flavobacteriales bacterium]